MYVLRTKHTRPESSALRTATCYPLLRSTPTLKLLILQVTKGGNLIDKYLACLCALCTLPTILAKPPAFLILILSYKPLVYACLVITEYRPLKSRDTLLKMKGLVKGSVVTLDMNLSSLPLQSNLRYLHNFKSYFDLETVTTFTLENKDKKISDVTRNAFKELLPSMKNLKHFIGRLF